MNEALDLPGIGNGIALTSVRLGDPSSRTMTVTKRSDEHTVGMAHAHVSGTAVDEGVVTQSQITYRLHGCILSGFASQGETETWDLSYAELSVDIANESSTEPGGTG